MREHIDFDVEGDEVVVHCGKIRAILEHAGFADVPDCCASCHEDDDEGWAPRDEFALRLAPGLALLPCCALRHYFGQRPTSPRALATWWFAVRDA